MFRSYKTQLDPNNKQKTLFAQHAGCARWAFNWALSKKKEAFDKKERIPSWIDLSKELNRLKKSELNWMYLSSKVAPLEALRNCETAFKSFFQRCKDKRFKKKGFPKFKSKKGSQSFCVMGHIHVDDHQIKLPRIGWVKLHQAGYLPTNSKILSATISQRAGKWFVSLNVEEAIKIYPTPLNNVVGVDLGVKTLATCSDGTIYNNPQALLKNLKKLKRKCRQLSRKRKESKNREKARNKLASLHYKISNIRKDSLHKATSKITDENQVIILEDLSVSKMLKNKLISRCIGDVGFYEFRRQITYKADWKGRQIIFVNRFYPSSKTCSSCGHLQETMPLSKRTFQCSMCDLKIDRDLNAAKNIYTHGLGGIQACGEGSSLNENLVTPLMKQESNEQKTAVSLE